MEVNHIKKISIFEAEKSEKAEKSQKHIKHQTHLLNGMEISHH